MRRSKAADLLKTDFPIRSLVLQAFVLTYSLTAGAFRSNPPSVMSDPEGLARLAIAVAVGVLGILIRDRVGRQNERSGNSLAVDLIVIYGLVIMSQLLLVFLRSELVLPRWAPTQGGFVGFILFAATRALFGAPPTAVGVPCSEADDGMIRELINAANHYRRLYGIAALLVSTVGVLGLFASSLRLQMAAAITVIGSVCLLWRTLFGQPRLRRHLATSDLTVDIQVCEAQPRGFIWRSFLQASSPSSAQGYIFIGFRL